VQGLGIQRLGELDLGPRFAVLVQKLVEPAAVPDALLAGQVLDDSIERDVSRLPRSFPSRFSLRCLVGPFSTEIRDGGEIQRLHGASEAF